LLVFRQRDSGQVSAWSVCGDKRNKRGRGGGTTQDNEYITYTSK